MYPEVVLCVRLGIVLLLVDLRVSPLLLLLLAHLGVFALQIERKKKGFVSVLSLLQDHYSSTTMRDLNLLFTFNEFPLRSKAPIMAPMPKHPKTMVWALRWNPPATIPEAHPAATEFHASLVSRTLATAESVAAKTPAMAAKGNKNKQFSKGPTRWFPLIRVQGCQLIQGCHNCENSVGVTKRISEKVSVLSLLSGAPVPKCPFSGTHCMM